MPETNLAEINFNGNGPDPEEILSKGSHQQTIKLENLKVMLEHHGFIVTPHHGGSHYKYYHPDFKGITGGLIHGTKKLTCQIMAAKNCHQVRELIAKNSATTLTTTFENHNGSDDTPLLDLDTHMSDVIHIKRYGELFALIKKTCPHVGTTVSNQLTEKSLSAHIDGLNHEEEVFNAQIQALAEEYELTVTKNKLGDITLHQEQYTLSCTLPPYTPFNTDGCEKSLKTFTGKLELLDTEFWEINEDNNEENNDPLPETPENSTYTLVETSGETHLHVSGTNPLTKKNVSVQLKTSPKGRPYLDSYFESFDLACKTAFLGPNATGPHTNIDSKTTQKMLAPYGFEVSCPRIDKKTPGKELIIRHPVYNIEAKIPVLHGRLLFLDLWTRCKKAEQGGQAQEVDNLLLDLVDLKYDVINSFETVLDKIHEVKTQNTRDFEAVTATLKDFNFEVTSNFDSAKSDDEFIISLANSKQKLSIPALKLNDSEFFVDCLVLEELKKSTNQAVKRYNDNIRAKETSTASSPLTAPSTAPQTSKPSDHLGM